MLWKNRFVLVTGGASFIGSHLVKALVARGAKVRVVDDLSSGKLENIKDHLENEKIEFIKGDLREPGVARDAMKGIKMVFHLAADHGGRGYVELHQAGPASNLFLDGIVFWEAVKAKVEKVVFASSACVYPHYTQEDLTKEIYLKEEAAGPPYEADQMYGWAKLMAELTLKAYHKEYGLKATSCRYFTVYGPLAVENHAVMALIARAFVKQSPFEVWGDGTAVRNWTYVDDIVEGTVLAGEKIDDGTAINLGTNERISVSDAAKMVLEYTNHKADIKFLPDMPVGPLNRSADNSRARDLLGWEPKVLFKEGLKRTIEWYFSTKKKDKFREIPKHILTER